MGTLSRRLGTVSVRGVILGAVLCAYLLPLALPVKAEPPREFRPVPRGEMYERQFLDDFFDALGCRPEGLSWVDESETVRLLVTAGVQAERGDSDDALVTLDLLPDTIASAFPFLATMREDLLVPAILEPWYENEDARRMLFRFYEDHWLPHPEYRDDFTSFQDDTMGRASRRDPDVPAVWIIAHLADYGFVPDQALQQDDPYLFLWDLLTGVTYYAQRAGFYGLQWDRYNAGDYKREVIRRIGGTVRIAYDEAVRRDVGQGFWSTLIDSYHPFEVPTEGVEATGEMVAPAVDEPTSRDDTGEIEIPPHGAATQATERDHEDLFRPPPEVVPEDGAAEEIESRIEALSERVQAEEEEIEEVPVEEVPVEEIPDEFLVREEELTPSEAAPEPEPPTEVGTYAMMRLGEIADDLALRIGELAAELGRETIDLVMLYNDVNVSEETIVNAEDRYIAKREAFLAGLGVWDRFDMEIYSPLTLADFNGLIVNDLRAPYERLKSREAEWAQYEAFESRFDEAFGQIENGVRDRRDDENILAAEAAALTAFLGEYNDMMKEIEDLLAGAITEAPVEP